MTTQQGITHYLTQQGITFKQPPTPHTHTNSATIHHKKHTTHDLWIHNNNIILLQSFTPKQDYPYGHTTRYPLEDPNTLDNLTKQIKQNHKSYTINGW